jgi:hypothetical protein
MHVVYWGLWYRKLVNIIFQKKNNDFDRMAIMKEGEFLLLLLVVLASTSKLTTGKGHSITTDALIQKEKKETN